jgi:hypothetical protein
MLEGAAYKASGSWRGEHTCTEIWEKEIFCKGGCAAVLLKRCAAQQRGGGSSGFPSDLNGRVVHNTGGRGAADGDFAKRICGSFLKPQEFLE